MPRQNNDVILDALLRREADSLALKGFPVGSMLNRESGLKGKTTIGPRGRSRPLDALLEGLVGRKLMSRRTAKQTASLLSAIDPTSGLEGVLEAISGAPEASRRALLGKPQKQKRALSGGVLTREEPSGVAGLALAALPFVPGGKAGKIAKAVSREQQIASFNKAVKGGKKAWQITKREGGLFVEGDMAQAIIDDAGKVAVSRSRDHQMLRESLHESGRLKNPSGNFDPKRTGFSFQGEFISVADMEKVGGDARKAFILKANQRGEKVSDEVLSELSDQ